MKTSIDLFYQSMETQIPQQMKHVHLIGLKIHLLRNFYDALYNFYIDQSLELFDPHVGDWACQIRAYQLAVIHSKITSDSLRSINFKLNEIKLLISKLEFEKYNYKILQKKKYYYLNHKSTLKDFLFKNRYFILIETFEEFLFYSRYLNNYKYKNISHKTEINKKLLATELRLGIHSANAFIKTYQHRLSSLSCNIIEKLIKNPSFGEQINVRTLVKEDIQNRRLLPCYLITKAILKNIQEGGGYIVIKINRFYSSNFIDSITLTLKLNEKTKKIEVTNFDLIHACMVFECVVQYQSNLETQNDYINRLFAFGIEKAILCNMAAHPQYPNQVNFSEDLVAQVLGDDYNFNKKIALLAGCNIENKSLLYINHVYIEHNKSFVNVNLNQINYNEQKQLLSA